MVRRREGCRGGGGEARPRRASRNMNPVRLDSEIDRSFMCIVDQIFFPPA